MVGVTTSTSASPTAHHVLLAALTAPVRARAWLCTIHLIVGFPLAIISFTLVAVLVPLTGGLAVLVVPAVLTGVLLLWTLRGLTAVQRSRFAEVLHVHIPPLPPRDRGATFASRLIHDLGSGDTWRQVAYHLLALPISILGFVAAVAGWSTGIAWTLAPLYRDALPERGSLGIPVREWSTMGIVTALGVALLLLTPWVVEAVAALDMVAARTLLGPSRTEVLARRVETLSKSRAGAVDAADTERRRIERDLHDGAQQRLVSLAMNLGMTRAALPDDLPEPTRQAIESAHDEAKQALTELRDFVRGLHPAVLNDRGLDAALSGIAARSPVPVRLRVNVPERCSPTVEAIAYFVVSEALTNIARHAQASQAEVSVDRTGGGGLRLVIADDGCGGASLDAGSGLRGLAQRVASIDGNLILDSPVGGPTVIAVELPCVS